MDGPDLPRSTADDVRLDQSESHASDDPEDVNFQSTANDGVTDYENDDLSNNDEDIVASNSPSDYNQFTEITSRLLPLTNRGDGLVDGSSSQSVPVRQNLVGNSTSTTEYGLMDSTGMSRRGQVDGNREGLSVHLSSHGCISPSEDYDDDRDPNYATQRPDTLGAINLATAAASAFAGPVARPAYPVAAAARAWPLEYAAEDSSFADDGTAHLGRRTCGAGMDQVELNQRQLMSDDEAGGSDDDGDGSELCDDDDDDDDEDTGFGNGNQCESTEADQYKMDPEADQSASAVEIPSIGHNQVTTDLLQENGSGLTISHDVRSGACGCSVGLRRRTDGAVSDVSHDMDDPEEDQADRAVSVENARMESTVLKPLDTAHHAVAAVCDERKHAALKQHPQSAFSIPKPRISKSKPSDSDSASYSNRPVPSVRQSKSNTDIIFKPISTTSAGKPNSLPRALMTAKNTDGSSVTETIHGEFTHHAGDKAHRSAQDRGMSLDKTDAHDDIESNRHHVSKPAAASGRSVWSGEPLWNTMDQPFVAWNDAHTSNSVSLPSSCHLPGEASVGTFAPANSSSQQTTPQKADTRACGMLNSSLDMSPIQPASSSSSRPLSVNGLHAVDLASVNGIFPSTELYLGTQASLPQHSHKVRLRYLFLINEQ